MKFVFRSQAQACAFDIRQSAGFRSVAIHAAAVLDASDRFLRDQLLRKREKTLSREKA